MGSIVSIWIGGRGDPRRRRGGVAVSMLTARSASLWQNGAMPRPLVYVLVVCLSMSPAVAAERDVLAQQLRAGEAMGGFPNWAERVIQEWINRARVDPQAALAGCAGCLERACYAPMPPLYWDPSLNRAARFHSDEQTKQSYFAHDSHCAVVSNIDQLYPVGCDGAASCACVGGSLSCGSIGCTPWNARVGLFGTSPTGEIMAIPAEPNTAFNLWMNESASSSACGFSSGAGHRVLILTSNGAIGVGASGRVAVGDFGGNGVPYRIASGSHYPQQAASVELWANWYDASAPRSAAAVVDGQCISMSLRLGTSKNGAWSATATGVGNGCHRYYFSFVDADGATVTYPATGSLGIGPCADWDTTRLQGSCASQSAPSRHRTVRH